MGDVDARSINDPGFWDSYSQCESAVPVREARGRAGGRRGRCPNQSVSRPPPRRITAMTTPKVQASADSSDGPLRAVRVLEALAGMEQPAQLHQVLVATGLSKSKAYRSLRFLQEAGFIDHVGRDGYRIGSRSLALASLIGPRPALLVAARPILRWLTEVASETAVLNLRSGSHRVLVLGVEARDQPIRGAVQVGERAPLTSGASGLSILAHLPAEETDAIMRSRPRRERKPNEVALAKIRKDGYSMTFSDNHVGINGIAAPLLTGDGYPLGSIGLGGAEGRLPEAKLRQLSVPLRRACKKLAPDLAKLLGPNSSTRLAALDVTIRTSSASEQRRT